MRTYTVKGDMSGPVYPKEKAPVAASSNLTGTSATGVSSLKRKASQAIEIHKSHLNSE
jgi:hypothetical protein